MANLVQDTLLRFWSQGRKTKATPSGWISGNAPCCVYNGEKSDTRGRGGMMTTEDGGITFHCFNCHYKTGWRPGRGLGLKFRKLLKWMNVSESEINLLRFETLKYVNQGQQTKSEVQITFEPRTLPAEAKTAKELVAWYKLSTPENQEELNAPADFEEVVTYVLNREIDVVKYDIAWTPQTEMKLNRRVIIPFYYKSELVGHTARVIDDGVKPKYLSNHPPHFVFNLDMQTPEKKFVVVCEGPFDAMSIDGVALNGSEINEKQIALIKQLNRRVIVVPDADIAGRKMIKQCTELGWEVSFPAWQETCKDINAAVVKYGKLFTLKCILESSIKSKLKIELKLKGLS
jgi:hypothetical protein